MKILYTIAYVLRNKYVLSIVAFSIWMLFFDKNDLFIQMERKRELNALRESKKYYTEEISREKKVSQELHNNPAAIEKYARETYLMKRENEDVFVIVDDAE